MSNERTCPICEASLKKAGSNSYQHLDRAIDICNECYNKIMYLKTSTNTKKVESARMYFSEKLKTECANEDGRSIINSVLTEVEGEQKNNVHDISSSTSPLQNNDERSNSLHDNASSADKTSMNTTVLRIIGAVFAIAAIILFIISIKDVSVGDYTFQVANFQETVFSAVCFISSVVCFVGASISK